MKPLRSSPIIRWQLAAVLGLGLCALTSHGDEKEDVFTRLNASTGWNEVFHDAGTGDWRKGWFLDGDRATVKNTPDGFDFNAGPERGKDADHAVLWTQKSFQGELKIIFDYTRTDHAERDVNILYLHAQGTGEVPYVKDLAAWKDLRHVPAMRIYFQHLKAWHISFAAFQNQGPVGQPDYIRVRRYPVTPERTFSETEVPPTYEGTGLFVPGQTYAMTIIKTAAWLFLEVRHGDKVRLFSWDVSHFPSEEAGRIGLRHMNARSARYANFTVLQRPPR